MQGQLLGASGSEYSQPFVGVPPIPWTALSYYRENSYRTESPEENWEVGNDLDLNLSPDSRYIILTSFLVAKPLRQARASSAAA